MIEPLRLRRILLALAIALPGCAAVAVLMVRVPPGWALLASIIGMIVFKTGHELHINWCTVCGGVLMFGAIFAWAIRQ